MQRPPGGRSPQILFSRSANEWINRVSQKHKQFAELQLSVAEKAALKRWIEIEFVCCALRLESLIVSREQVARLTAQAAFDDAAMSEPEMSEPERAAIMLLGALRKIEDLALSEGRAARLTPEFLASLNEAGFRATPGDTSRRVRPVAAESLSAIIESVCRWYTAESFEELNPVEQSSIVLLRLAEIQPFEKANLATALVAASLSAVRSQLPPIIIRPESAAAFFRALEEGSRMNTSPMVEMIAGAIEKTLDEMIAQVKSKK
jgi:hypothetical protein